MIQLNYTLFSFIKEQFLRT